MYSDCYKKREKLIVLIWVARSLNWPQWIAEMTSMAQIFHKIVSKTQYFFFFFSKACRCFFFWQIYLAVWILDSLKIVGAVRLRLVTQISECSEHFRSFLMFTVDQSEISTRLFDWISMFSRGRFSLVYLENKSVQ